MIRGLPWIGLALMLLSHLAMKLKSLPSCYAKGIVRAFRREPIERQILICIDHPTWHTPTDHEDVLFADFTFIAVILLVNAVELEELAVIF